MFNPDNLDDIFSHIDKLKDAFKRQQQTVAALEASVIHECSRYLDHATARAHYAASKELEIKALMVAWDFKFDLKSGKVPLGSWNRAGGKKRQEAMHEAESAWARMQRAAVCYEQHGGCDIGDDDYCRRCTMSRDTDLTRKRLEEEKHVRKV